MKTSEEWYWLDESITAIMDPDGWDIKNYQYSWFEELITQEEYEKRKMRSTCLFKRKDDGSITM